MSHLAKTYCSRLGSLKSSVKHLLWAGPARTGLSGLSRFPHLIEEGCAVDRMAASDILLSLLNCRVP